MLNVPQREKRASAIAFIALTILCVAPQRSFFPQGALLYNYNWSQVVAFVASIVCFLLLLPKIRMQHSIKSFVKVAWPLVLYATVELGFLIYGYGHRFNPDLVGSYSQSWWINYAGTIVLLPLLFFLGYIINWDAKWQAAFMVTEFFCHYSHCAGRVSLRQWTHEPNRRVCPFLKFNNRRYLAVGPSI